MTGCNCKHHDNDLMAGGLSQGNINSFQEDFAQTQMNYVAKTH